MFQKLGSTPMQKGATLIYNCDYPKSLSRKNASSRIQDPRQKPKLISVKMPSMLMTSAVVLMKSHQKPR